jgi:hypothetical protein
MRQAELVNAHAEAIPQVAALLNLVETSLLRPLILHVVLQDVNRLSYLLRDPHSMRANCAVPSQQEWIRAPTIGKEERLAGESR